MNLVDSVQLYGPTGDGEPGYDEQGYPLPPPEGVIATLPAYVFYAQSGIEIQSYGLTVLDQLRCIIEEPPVEIDPGIHRIIWRGGYYTITGRLIRSRAGKTHHLTLNLSGT